MPRKSTLILSALLFWAASLNAATCSIEGAAVFGRSVWLLCDRDSVLVSADAGATWQTRSLTSEAKARAIAVLNPSRAFVAGDEGLLMATADGGQTWSRVPLPVRENLRAIHFVGESGWLAGWNGIILHSGDGGKTWERQPSGVLQGLDGIFFTDSEHGWAVGWVGTILRTANGGKTWEKPKTPPNLWSLNSVYFQDANNGWAAGFNGQILRSRDGGATWEKQASPVQAWLRSVAADNSGRVWIAAETEVLVSADGGASWTVTPAEGAIFLHQVLRVEDSLWAVGQFSVFRQSGRETKLTALATLPISDFAGDNARD
jgi:photosystem II stability/assembly factor-like uncharacterized protein